jgi:hypothetical protein
MATSALQSDDEPTPQTPTDTVMRMCQGDCMQHTPHVLKTGYCECVICQNRIYATDTTRSNNG